MVFEKYLEKLIGLRVEMYAGEGLSESQAGTETQPIQGDLKIREHQNLYEDIQKTDTSTDKKVSKLVLELLKSIEESRNLLDGIKAGEKIVGKKIKILGNVETITDTDDFEYERIISIIGVSQKELKNLGLQHEQVDSKVQYLERSVKTMVYADKISEIGNKKIQEAYKKYPKIPSQAIDNVIKGALINTDSFEEILDGMNPITDESIEKGVSQKIDELMKQNERNPFLIGEKEDVEAEKLRTTLEAKKNQLQETIKKTEIPTLSEEVLKKTRLLEGIKEEIKSGHGKTDNFTVGDLTKGRTQLEKGLQELQTKIGAIKKEQGIDALETEIKEIEGKLWQKTAPVREVISRYPVTFGEKTTKAPIGLMKLINQFFKAFFGVDFFKIPQEQKISYESMISGKDSNRLGSLSEKFESGGKGPEYIEANDAGLGFPSYGTYQMNRDTLKGFVKKFNEKYSSKSITLTGNSNQPGTDTEFAKSWRDAISKVGKEEFIKFEHEYVKSTYYDQQVKKIEGLGIKESKMSLTFKNVIWSTAVQHGQNTDLIASVLKKMDANETQNWSVEVEKKVVKAIYEERTRRYPPTASRYSQEMGIALTQLDILPRGPNGEIRSFGVEYTASGTTACSRTAAKNGAMLGYSFPDQVHAHDLKSAYEKENGGSLPEFSGGSIKGKVVDLFSKSSDPRYAHRSVAYNEGGKWFVLDPYLQIDLNKRERNEPIPLDRYQAFLKNHGRGPLLLGKAYGG